MEGMGRYHVLKMVLLVGLCCPDCLGIDTLIGIQGKGFVMLASDPLLHRSLVVMQQDRDKLPVVGRRRMLAIGGPPFFVDGLGELVRAEVGLLEKRLRRPVSTRVVAQICRRLFLEFKGLPCTMLVAGFNEATSSAGPEEQGPCLFWMDSLGALQRLRYGVHGEASSFLMSLLDQACGPQGCTDGDDAGSGLTEEQALEVLRKCHSELCQRFLVNAGSALEVKVVDRNGCRRVKLGLGENKVSSR